MLPSHGSDRDQRVGQQGQDVPYRCSHLTGHPVPRASLVVDLLSKKCPLVGAQDPWTWEETPAGLGRSALQALCETLAHRFCGR